METDSAEKVDTQHGSCYSHLLAPKSATLSTLLIEAVLVICCRFVRFSLAQPSRAVDSNVETLAGPVVKLQQSKTHFTCILEVNLCPNVSVHKK